MTLFMGLLEDFIALVVYVIKKQYSDCLHYGHVVCAY